MKSNQNTAWCNGCDGFIKNISQGNPFTFHFGKYKGRLLSDFSSPDDISYLKWMIEQSFCKNTLKNTIQTHLDNIKNG
jgi:uncharacterized protein (DUF3820 family)